MRAIFISYRREDAEGQAGRLYDDLASHFGEDTVFMDVAGIAPGRDFRRVIDEHVATCGVLLAMIGKSWIDAKDETGRRRLEDPMDFVRLETASALKRDIAVVPVLVHGARMPRAEQLPEDLAELAYRNGVELTHARWDSDVQVLIKALSPYVESLQAGAGGAQKTQATQPGAETRPDSAAPPTAAPPAKKSLAMIVAASLAAMALAFGGYRIYQYTAEKAELARIAEQEKIAAEKAKAAEAERLALESAKQQAEAERVAAENTRAEAEKIAREKARQQAEGERIAAERAKIESERIALERARRQQIEADRIAAEKAQAAEAERIALERAKRQAEADRVAAAKARAAEAERSALERARQAAAAQRARWPYYKFPPPNAGLLVFTIMPDGNPACASYDAASCLWGVAYDQIDFKRLRPVVCGEAHRAKWGVTGYEDPKHWCSLAKRVRANPS
jgi:hypothetical protein